jgi:hypothetical protein
MASHKGTIPSTIQLQIRRARHGLIQIRCYRYLTGLGGLLAGLIIGYVGKNVGGMVGGLSKTSYGGNYATLGESSRYAMLQRRAHEALLPLCFLAVQPRTNARSTDTGIVRRCRTNDARLRAQAGQDRSDTMHKRGESWRKVRVRQLRALLSFPFCGYGRGSRGRQRRALSLLCITIIGARKIRLLTTSICTCVVAPMLKRSRRQYI